MRSTRGQTRRIKISRGVGADREGRWEEAARRGRRALRRGRGVRRGNPLRHRLRRRHLSQRERQEDGLTRGRPHGAPGQRLAKRKARKEKQGPSVNHPTASAGSLFTRVKAPSTERDGARQQGLARLFPSRAGTTLVLAKLDRRASSRHQRLFLFWTVHGPFSLFLRPEKEKMGGAMLPFIMAPRPQGQPPPSPAGGPFFPPWW